jgi:hypothetical protein
MPLSVDLYNIDTSKNGSHTLCTGTTLTGMEQGKRWHQHHSPRHSHPLPATAVSTIPVFPQSTLHVGCGPSFCYLTFFSVVGLLSPVCNTLKIKKRVYTGNYMLCVAQMHLSIASDACSSFNSVQLPWRELSLGGDKSQQAHWIIRPVGSITFMFEYTISWMSRKFSPPAQVSRN